MSMRLYVLKRPSHRSRVSKTYKISIGQQNESIKKAEPETGFENTEDLSKMLTISRASLKF